MVYVSTISLVQMNDKDSRAVSSSSTTLEIKVAGAFELMFNMASPAVSSSYITLEIILAGVLAQLDGSFMKRDIYI